MAGKRTLASIVGAGAAASLIVLVPKFEGMVLRGYKDPIGIVTACAGHTKTAILGRAYTLKECNELLDQDLAEHAAATMACIRVDTTPNERAAYTSATYNIGGPAWCRSSMVRLLNAGDHRGACEALLRYVYGGGRVLKGLVIRRQIERDLCVQGLPT